MKNKLDEWYKSRESAASMWGQQSTQAEAVESSHVGRLKHLVQFLVSYPVFHAMFEALMLIYRIGYMFEHVAHFSPFLHLQRLVVQRMSMMDMLQQIKTPFRDQLQRKITNNEMGLMMKLMKTGRNLVQLGLDSIKYFLLASVFSFRFMDWWYSSDTSAAVRPKVLVVPPPSIPAPVHQNGIVLPEDRSLCGLCNTKRKNSAATPSGYVFCFQCIFDHVEVNEHCPVTHWPLTHAGIRKIWEDNG